MTVSNAYAPSVAARGYPRKHLGERLWDLWEKIRTRTFTAFVSRQFGACGSGAIIEPPFRFKNLQHVVLGPKVILNRGCWISAIASDDDRTTPKIVIGAETSIGMGATISAVRQIVLGDHVMLAKNVYISDHGHAFEDVSVPIMFQGIRGVSEVSIGASTWLGQNVCVMPGVHIGRHCIIGANSIVNRDIPPFSVAVGAPAKVVKRYDEKTRRWEKVIE